MDRRGLRHSSPSFGLGAGPTLQREDTELFRAPAGSQVRQQTHGLDDFRIVQLTLGTLGRLDRVPVRLCQIGASCHLIPDREPHQQEHRQHRHGPKET